MGEEESHSNRGKKRNPFRRKHGDESAAHLSEGVEHGSNHRNTKLRWAQHLAQRDHSSSEDGSVRSHPWKVSSGNKLNWSPRVGQGKRGGGTEANNDDDVLVGATTNNNGKERHHPWNEGSKNKLGLHWSPRFVRKNRNDNVDQNGHSQTGIPFSLSEQQQSRGTSVDDGASSENDCCRYEDTDTDIPRQVGGAPVHNEGGSKKKFSWRVRSSDLSDTLSDDVSEASSGSSARQMSSERISRIKRKLNPRGKSSQWKSRMGEHRIDEDQEHVLPPGSELESLATFSHQNSLAGDFEVSADIQAAAFRNDGMNGSANRQRSATEPNINLASLTNDREFHRVHSLERNTSPRDTSPKSLDSGIMGLRGGHSRAESGASSVASESAARILPEHSPVHSYRKSEKKSENRAFRVKPYRYFDPPVYMNESEIHEFMLQPSQNVEFLESFIAPSSKRTETIKVSGEMERIWGSTSDGRVGSLRVEVLGCVGLASYKPDVSAYLILGDVPFVTDVIPSCRSPRWPPNCKRAAIFPVHHAYARLFTGVFASKKDKANDEFCGRVVLDLASLRPDTEYDVTLPLRASSFIYDRRPRGVIRLRFSLHWFSERAAVWSYLKSPQNLAVSSFGDNPSILCGDPKTFRNVAITLHGQDLPGKFTRKAFQATMREFNLTRLNLIFLAKTLATEAVLYQKPLVSLYIFVTWMHCVYADSVKLAPAYFVGYLILCLFNNYESFNQDQDRYLGFAPPTLQELLFAMFSRAENHNIQPILVEKHVSNPSLRSNYEKLMSSQRGVYETQISGSVHDNSREFSGEIKPLDHREFPFSEKIEYPRFRPEDAIVPSKHTDLAGAAASDQYLYGRLTEFASEKMNSLQSALPTVTSGDDDDVWEISDHEEEDIELVESDGLRDDGDSVFLESDDEEEGGGLAETSTRLVQQATRRIPVGPPQNCDDKAVKRVPPQVMLARAENRLHSLTFGLSMDKLFHTSLAVGKRISGGLSPTNDDDLPPDTYDTNAEIRRKKRSLLDEFDKRLGLRTRSKNPVVGITSSFLGPIMRMFRIWLMAIRIVFNIGVWKDPFLSFWVLCFLVALMFILLIFPWRCFMFLSGLVCFGPQNILVRRRLLYKAAKAEKEEQSDPETIELDKDEDTNTEPSEASFSVDSKASSSDETLGSIAVTADMPEASTEDDASKKKLSRRRRLTRKLAKMRERRRSKKRESLAKEPPAPPAPTRPVFSAATYHKPSKVPLEPREVVVPYTRVRTERFYDWPPDPTMSRAAPVLLSDYDETAEDFIVPIGPGQATASARGVVRRRHSSEM